MYSMVQAPGMKTSIVVSVIAQDCIRLEAIIADRNTRQKHVSRPRVIVATADGCGATGCGSARRRTPGRHRGPTQRCRKDNAFRENPYAKRVSDRTLIHSSEVLKRRCGLLQPHNLYAAV